MTAREQLAHKLADLVDDEEVLRALVAFLERRATGQVLWHVLRGQVQGADCNDMYRKRSKPVVR
jgi:hypothetical protein